MSSATYLFKDFEVKTGHNPKIGTTAAPKGLVQIRILINVGLNDAAVRQDNLVLANIVARPAVLSREPRNTSTERESADANLPDAAAHDSQTLRVKELRDGGPPIPGTHRNDRLVIRELQAVEPNKVDHDAVVNVRAREGNVTTGLDGEGRLELPDHLEGLGDVAGGVWGDEAVGCELLLTGRPVLVLGVVVGRVWGGDLARKGNAERDALEGPVSCFSWGV